MDRQRVRRSGNVTAFDKRTHTDGVVKMRSESSKELTNTGAATPYAFQQIRQKDNETVILVPRHSSERREFLPISYFQAGAIVADGAFGVFNADLWVLALLVSRIHLVWIATVCGKIKTDFRYLNTLGWNTFPVPLLTTHYSLLRISVILPFAPKKSF